MKNLFLGFIIAFFCYQNSQAQANVNTWTWIKGANTIDQTSIYGIRGVANATNRPSAVYEHVSWTYNGKMYLFGGIGKDSSNQGGRLHDLWEFDHSTLNWTWIKGKGIKGQASNYGVLQVPAASNLPSGRIFAASWIYNGQLYLFGGEDGSQTISNDLWRYSIATKNWTWIKGAGPNITNQAGIYGTQGVAAVINTPGARYKANTWVYNNKVYLFGGNGFDKNGVQGFLNDLWEYNPITNNWTWLKGANVVNQLGSYGGQGLPSAFNRPGCRENFSTWVSNGLLYLMGGFGLDNNTTSSAYFNDLWQYNPNNNIWTWLKGSNLTNQLGVYGTKGIPNANNTPGARVTAVTWTVNDRLYMMGGYGKSSIPTNTSLYLNDLWEYDSGSNNWRWLKGSNNLEEYGTYGTIGLPALGNSPGAKDDHTSWFYNGKLYLFGGYGYDGTNGIGSLNDIWEYVPACTDMYSLKSGNWNDGNTWSCGRVPIATDPITIKGHIIDLAGNCFAKNIIYNNSGSLNFTISSNLKLNP
jgi:N-acetylneuraminic acid mutarotase